MEFEISKLKCLQYKVALSIAIIRNRPKDLSLDQYLQLLRVNFTHVHEKFSDEIQQLRLRLLDAKKEIFYLKTKEIIKDLDGKLDEKTLGQLLDTTKKFNYSKNESKFQDLITQFNSNLEFITNLIKLKTIDKDFKENQSVDQETLLDCLNEFLSQIKKFLFNYEFKQDISSNIPSSFIVTDTIDTNEPIVSKEPNDESFCITFPIESILHGVQVFLNLFEIEWFYYLRNKLIEQIVLLIDEIVRFIIKFDSKKANNQKLFCCNQILFIFSTSDYLLNQIVFSIINSLKISIEYLLDMKRFLQINSQLDDSSRLEKQNEIHNVSNNCILLTECLAAIAQMRLLEYYTPISDQTKIYLNNTLNSIFINLTDTFPIIAIKLSKLIQLISLNK
ncbi:unnamed protein product [Brachionus calyciflorus]|uniref:Uncharacterized protein n=1 Tax=Brachionus calyciflorus TaxID=104777 RepID=A0A813PLZ6_9BILA|nr:unnamed protein product [Brachionus calyciflorus]